MSAEVGNSEEISVKEAENASTVCDDGTQSTPKVPDSESDPEAKTDANAEAANDAKADEIQENGVAESSGAVGNAEKVVESAQEAESTGESAEGQASSPPEIVVDAASDHEPESPTADETPAESTTKTDEVAATEVATPKEETPKAEETAKTEEPAKAEEPKAEETPKAKETKTEPEAPKENDTKEEKEVDESTSAAAGETATAAAAGTAVAAEAAAATTETTAASDDKAEGTKEGATGGIPARTESGKPNFAGKYRQVEAENTDGFFQAVGLPWLLRKVATRVSPTMDIKQGEDKFQIKFVTGFMTKEMKFTVGEDFEDPGMGWKKEVNTLLEVGDVVCKRVFERKK